jgi:hypothetical protein
MHTFVVGPIFDAAIVEVPSATIAVVGQFYHYYRHFFPILIRPLLIYFPDHFPFSMANDPLYRQHFEKMIEEQQKRMHLEGIPKEMESPRSVSRSSIVGQFYHYYRHFFPILIRPLLIYFPDHFPFSYDQQEYFCLYLHKVLVRKLLTRKM